MIKPACVSRRPADPPARRPETGEPQCCSQDLLSPPVLAANSHGVRQNSTWTFPAPHRRCRKICERNEQSNCCFPRQEVDAGRTSPSTSAVSMVMSCIAPAGRTPYPRATHRRQRSPRPGDTIVRRHTNKIAQFYERRINLPLVDYTGHRGVMSLCRSLTIFTPALRYE